MGISLGSLLSKAQQAVGNVGQSVANYGKNALMNVLGAGNTWSRLLGGSGTTTTGLMSKLSEKAPQPGQSTISSAISNPLGLPEAKGDFLAPTKQLGQTAPASASVVSPQALASVASQTNQAGPPSEKVNTASVPIAPQLPALSRGAQSPAPSGVSFSGSGSFGGGVDMATLLRALAQAPGRTGTPGYVGTPEGGPIGAGTGGKRLREKDFWTP